MVGVAVGWIAYIFAGLFSSTSGSQTVWLPPPVVQRARPTQAAPAPIWGPGDTTAKAPDRNTDSSTSPARAVASNSDGPPLTASSPARDPSEFWGDAPYGVAPDYSIPPLTPVNPLVGPDF